MAEKILNLLEDIQKGISPSYLGKFSKINNVDIDSVPGVIFAKNQLSSYPAKFSASLENITVNAFTGSTTILLVDSGTNNVDNLFVGQAIKFSTTGTLPEEINTTTVYYVSDINYASDTIKIASKIKDAIDETNLITISNSGSGTHSVVPQYMREIKHYINGATYGKYALDASQQVWYKLSDGWTLITGNESGLGQGMAIWKGYLMVMCASEINVYGPLSAVGDTATWTNSIMAITSSSEHPSFVGQDGKLYIGCGTYLASLTEDTTFDPSSDVTYTLNTSALVVPTDIEFIDELSNTLLVASNKVIYPWDGISPSYDSPIFLNDELKAMRVYNNLLWFIDEEAVIWACNGSSVAKQGKLSQSDYTTKLSITNKIGIIDAKLYFGAYSLSALDIDSSGVYSFNPATGVIFQEYKSQSGQTANSRADCYDGTFTFYDAELATKYTASIQEVADIVGKYATTSFETCFLQVGTKRKPTTFKEYEFVLVKELSTSLAVTLKYRLNLTDSWTTIGSVSFASDGAVHSQIIDNSAVLADQIQFRIELTSRGTGFSTTPFLKAIYVR